MSDIRARKIADLKDAVSKAGIRYQAGKDRPSILKVQENFEEMTPNNAASLLPLICGNYKSLPPTGSDKLNKVMTKYGDLARSSGYGDKAPMKRWTEIKPDYIKFMNILMKDVDEKFRNWAVIMRALEDYLKPIVEVYKLHGNTEVKSLGYKGFFIFFFERADTQKYLSAQKYLTYALGTIAADHINKLKPRGGGLLKIPTTYEGWLKLYEGISLKLEAPNYDVWTSKIAPLFSKPALPAVDTNEAIANALQAWLLVRPGRFLIDRTQIIKNKKSIPIDWANEIAEAFGYMFKPFNGMFEGVPEVGEIESPEDLNKQLGIHYKIIRNAIAAFRTMVFSGEDIRLGPEMSRKFAIKLNLKAAFEKGLY